MPPSIRPIATSALDDAFGLLQTVARWLDGKGRRQRIAATTRETYLRWQSDGCNWGVFHGEQLAAIFTLVREPLHDWPDVEVSGAVPWLRALAVDPARRGQGIGGHGIRASLALVDAGEHLWLDCVSDFLPGYYAEHGFEYVARQTRTYPDGAYDITLMRQPGRRAPVIG